MRRSIVLTGKHGMAALILELKEAGENEEAIPVHMHQEKTEIQQLIDNNETTTVMVHAGQIKKNHNKNSTH